ncbi:hypothetical protein SeMB42_g07880 [Synchytrium endobioticum]|uniref:Uncharacterized protein n=1 Tax=Synchytrium endobioticum TaxID=286115 RepID=A0A507BJ93_9FUNG|nr:hypothetical protein SeMB42_g07880 [Synchytrium endobioticum]
MKGVMMHSIIHGIWISKLRTQVALDKSRQELGATVCGHCMLFRVFAFSFSSANNAAMQRTWSPGRDSGTWRPGNRSALFASIVIDGLIGVFERRKQRHYKKAGARKSALHLQTSESE